MNKAITIIAFIVLAYACKAQSQVALDSLLAKYCYLATTSKDNSLYKKRFFELFPNNFQLFNSIYGYTEMDDGYASFSPLYSDPCDHIGLFFSTINVVDRTLFYKKIIDISQNGHWAADAIACFQENLHKLLLNNTKQFLQILETYTDAKIKSFWQFFFANNIFNHPFNVEMYERVHEKIKALNHTRILTLVEEQWAYDYNKYINNPSECSCDSVRLNLQCPLHNQNEK